MSRVVSTSDEARSVGRGIEDYVSISMAGLNHQCNEESNDTSDAPTRRKRPRPEEAENITLPDDQRQVFNAHRLQSMSNVKELSKISLALGSSWHFLAYILDMTDDEIERCESNSHRIEEHILQMLKNWKIQNSKNGKATMYTLLKALLEYEELLTGTRLPA